MLCPLLRGMQRNRQSARSGKCRQHQLPATGTTLQLPRRTVPTAHSYVFLILEGQLCFDEVKLPSWQVLGLKGRFPRFWGYIIP